MAVRILTDAQIQSFLEDGVLVVENILNDEELLAASQGLQETLLHHGVDVEDLESTGQNLRHLSSTNGSGGVLDLFYDSWKLKVALHEKLFTATTELWEAACCHANESIDELAEVDRFKWHPYGSFDTKEGYIYIDRMGYRIPTALAERLGEKSGQGLNESTNKKKKAPLQRSLTPHLDCCPSNFFSENAKKWRPIQCFVSLSDTVQPDLGGFEAAKGFHRTFHAWSTSREPTTILRKNQHVETFNAPCVGEYTHMRPKEDAGVMKRVQHIEVPSGSAVFWDNRIPHANSYRHLGSTPRAVVYCSFLPNVPLNQQYSSVQLSRWKRGLLPSDQWINSDTSLDVHDISSVDTVLETSSISRKLIGLEPW